MGAQVLPRLAPLVTQDPTESVSALIALLVAYAVREPEPTEDFEALTVVERPVAAEGGSR